MTTQETLKNLGLRLSTLESQLNSVSPSAGKLADLREMEQQLQDLKANHTKIINMSAGANISPLVDALDARVSTLEGRLGNV